VNDFFIECVSISRQNRPRLELGCIERAEARAFLDGFVDGAAALEYARDSCSKRIARADGVLDLYGLDGSSQSILPSQ